MNYENIVQVLLNIIQIFSAIGFLYGVILVLMDTQIVQTLHKYYRNILQILQSLNDCFIPF